MKSADKAPAKVHELLKAKGELEAQFQALRDEQLAIIKEAQQRLAELGFNGVKNIVTKSRTTDRVKRHYCALCEVSGHDQRAHRSQGGKKRKFTAKELKERGL